MLPEIVRQTAIKFSNSAAYISQDGNKITYRELDQISQEVAAWMGSKGLGEGSVVALCLLVVSNTFLVILLQQN